MKTRVSTTIVMSIVPALILIVSTALADVPHLMNYQGRLTGGDGLPIPDDKYDISFTIWSDSVSTDPSEILWSSGYQTVIVENGLFDYMLGSKAALPDYFFKERADIFLGITLLGSSEMAPRQRIATSAFAFQALRADSAEYITGNQFVLADGDTLTGDLYLSSSPPDFVGHLDLGSNYADLHLYSGEIHTVYLYGQFYGSLYLNDGDGDRTAELDARNASGGRLRLMNSSGATTVVLDAGETGDNSAILPTDAVSADEIFNEPGIAHGENVESDGVTLPYGSYVDLTTVTITTPGPGYVYLLGRCYLQMGGITGWNGVEVQVDKYSGGTTSSYFTYEFTNLTATYWENASVFVDRYYYESTAGTYTYRLEAKKQLDTGTSIARRIMLTALFFPTSYGTTKSLVTDPGDNPDAVPITFVDQDGNSQSLYEVDLRYYEMKAQTARVKALEAELELERARSEATDRQKSR